MVPRLHANLAHAAAVLLLVVIGVGCQVQLISPYDQVTDQSLTALQQKTEEFFQQVERSGAPAAYAQSTPFYSSINTSLQTLITRNEGRPQNRITTTQLNTLKTQFQDLEAEHKNGALGADDIAVLRPIFTQSYAAIIKLELAKKRGESR